MWLYIYFQREAGISKTEVSHFIAGELSVKFSEIKSAASSAEAAMSFDGTNELSVKFPETQTQVAKLLELIYYNISNFPEIARKVNVEYMVQILLMALL